MSIFQVTDACQASYCHFKELERRAVACLHVQKAQLTARHEPSFNKLLKLLRDGVLRIPAEF
jgi:hypothetical protein